MSKMMRCPRADTCENGTCPHYSEHAKINEPVDKPWFRPAACYRLGIGECDSCVEVEEPAEAQMWVCEYAITCRNICKQPPLASAFCLPHKREVGCDGAYCGSRRDDVKCIPYVPAAPVPEAPPTPAVAGLVKTILETKWTTEVCHVDVLLTPDSKAFVVVARDDKGDKWLQYFDQSLQAALSRLLGRLQKDFAIPPTCPTCKRPLEAPGA